MSIVTGLNSTDILNLLRGELGDLDATGSGRWSNSQLLQFIDRGNKRLVADVLFPDCRIEQPTVANVQLYQFPLMLKTDRVYVGGQLVIPSDTSTLNGQQIGYWDRTGSGQQTPGPYTDIPANSNSGVAAPAWTVTTPLSYPTTDGQWVTPAPDAEPWYCGSTPRYYWRGGWLGLVPIPTNSNPVATIAIEGVRQPDTIDALDQTVTSPENFMDGIVYWAKGMAYDADAGSLAQQKSQQAKADYQAEKRRLQTWLGLFHGEQRNGPKVNTLRPAYSWMTTRRNRGNWGGGGWL